jgi:hypothetical protein
VPPFAHGQDEVVDVVENVGIMTDVDVVVESVRVVDKSARVVVGTSDDGVIDVVEVVDDGVGFPVSLISPEPEKSPLS